MIALRKALIAALSAVALMLVAVPAQAQGSGTLTISLSVPVAAELVVTDGAAAFGSVNPGTTQEQLGTFAWNVTTNSANGFTTSLTAAALSTPASPVAVPTIQIAKASGPAHTDPTYITVPSAGGSISTTWAATGSSTPASYTDSVKVTVPGNATPGSYSQVLTLNAVANP